MRRHGGSMGESDPVAIALFSIGEGKAYYKCSKCNTLASQHVVDEFFKRFNLLFGRDHFADARGE